MFANGAESRGWGTEQQRMNFGGLQSNVPASSLNMWAASIASLTSVGDTSAGASQDTPQVAEAFGRSHERADSAVVALPRCTAETRERHVYFEAQDDNVDNKTAEPPSSSVGDLQPRQHDRDM